MGRSHTEKLGTGLLSLMGSHSTLEVQYVYYTELNREAGFMHTAEHGPKLLYKCKQGGRVYGNQLVRGDRSKLIQKMQSL